MTTVYFRTVALMAAAIALTASPALAQREGRRNGGDGQRKAVERAQPRRGGESRGRVERNDDRRNDRRSSAATAPPSSRQWEGRRHGGDGGRREGLQRAQPRRGGESRGRLDWNDNRRNGSRAYRNRGYDNRWNDARIYDNRAHGNRRRDNRADNWRGYDNRAYGYGSYGRPHDNRAYRYRSRDYRSHGYRPPVYRSYVVPYGYRPYGYRPGWSLNLYFGRAYSAYGYPAYDYPAQYGYYSLVPGRAYGALRIVDAPPDARVFVDGYYAGVVDDYDGVFQHLNLEAGPHEIEIEVPGYPPIAFDVYIEPGRTITYRAPIY